MSLPTIGFLEFIDTLKEHLPEESCEVTYTEDRSILWDCAGLVFFWDSSTSIVYYYDRLGDEVLVTGIAMDTSHMKKIIRHSLEHWFLTET